jgi:hypothetical protein
MRAAGKSIVAISARCSSTKAATASGAGQTAINASQWLPIMTDHLTEEQQAAELSELMLSEYSRENQRRIFKIVKSESKGGLLERPSEDIFEDVAGFALSVLEKLSIRSLEFPQQHAYAFKMLRKLCLTSYSITVLVEDFEGKPRGSLDHASVAVLCRTIIDTAIMFWYLSEEISAEEWEFRLAVMNLHDTTSRVRLFKGLIPDEAEKQRLRRAKFKKALEDNALFRKRKRQDRDRLLGGQVLYVNGMRSLLRTMNYNEEYYDGVYSYLSSHVHSLPIAYFRDGPEGDPLTYYFPSMFVGYALHHAWTMIARVALRARSKLKWMQKC